MIGAKLYNLLIAPALMLVLACVGGSGGDDLSKALASVSPDDLASMVLGQDELGDEFAYMETNSDSGFSDDYDAAESTVDPNDTADDLARLGRIGGYSLTYVDPELAALDIGEGVISLSMELDLFRDSDGAAQFLAKQREDFQRLEGTVLENGVRLERTDMFPVDGLADGATGLRIGASIEDVEFYETVVAFRLDRLVVAAVLYRADSADVGSQVREIAGSLAKRIEEVSLNAALVSDQGELTGGQTESGQADGTLDVDLSGAWRIYSERIDFDAGGGNNIEPVTRELSLYDDGTWEFGSSSGTWYVTFIDRSDWGRWGVEPYGPERKIVLEGWNDDFGDGPIEESAGSVDFIWVIYQVDDPDPGTIQLKFGYL